MTLVVFLPDCSVTYFKLYLLPTNLVHSKLLHRAGTVIVQQTVKFATRRMCRRHTSTPGFGFVALLLATKLVSRIPTPPGCRSRSVGLFLHGLHLHCSRAFTCHRLPTTKMGMRKKRAFSNARYCNTLRYGCRASVRRLCVRRREVADSARDIVHLFLHGHRLLRTWADTSVE